MFAVGDVDNPAVVCLLFVDGSFVALVCRQLVVDNFFVVAAAAVVVVAAVRAVVAAVQGQGGVEALNCW